MTSWTLNLTLGLVQQNSETLGSVQEVQVWTLVQNQTLASLAY